MVVYMSGIYERSGREPFTVLVLVFHSLLLSLHCETVFAFVFDGFVFAHIDHEGFSTVCDQALNNVFTYLWTLDRGRGIDGACSLDQQRVGSPLVRTLLIAGRQRIVPLSTGLTGATGISKGIRKVRCGTDMFDIVTIL